MSSLDEKESSVIDYPNKWMVDLIRDQLAEASKFKVDYFYRSKALPTVLVGKQRHRLPFCRLNFSSEFLKDLSISGRDDPETLFEGGDVTLDALFIATWTVLNLDHFPLGEPDYKKYLECDYDTPLDLVDFLRFSSSPQMDMWLNWYWRIRPVPKPEIRFTLCENPNIEWWSLSPEGQMVNVGDFGSDFVDENKERNVIDSANVTFSRCLKNGWVFFINVFHSSLYTNPAPFLSALTEIYSATSKRSAEEIFKSLTWVKEREGYE